MKRRRCPVPESGDVTPFCALERVEVGEAESSNPVVPLRPRLPISPSYELEHMIHVPTVAEIAISLHSA